MSERRILLYLLVMGLRQAGAVGRAAAPATRARSQPSLAGCSTREVTGVEVPPRARVREAVGAVRRQGAGVRAREGVTR